MEKEKEILDELFNLDIIDEDMLNLGIEELLNADLVTIEQIEEIKGYL